MLLHLKQREIAQSLARFKVARAGRKGGKTAYEIESLCFKAIASVERLPYLKKTNFATGRKVIYVAPTQDQARKIVWEALKTRLHGIGKFNEQKLECRLTNDDGLLTTIFVGGYENRENYRGLTDVIHITFDEVDTLKEFFIYWREIFRPLFLDTGGTADFIGTPKKENPNLRRLEKEAENRPDWEVFHFTSRDNPHLPVSEIDAMEEEYAGDMNSYRQEVLAEYIDDAGALFRYTALVDMFSNSITLSDDKYLIVDVAGDGSDKTVFSFFQGLKLYKVEVYERLNTESIIKHIREYASEHQIPHSHIIVDAIGVGEGVATSSLLDGVVAYKSSYSAIKTDIDPVRLPNVHYRSGVALTTEYKNLRSQCVFTLANLINNHKISAELQDVRVKEAIIEELALYQDASPGDGKRMATKKEDVTKILGRSPDISDTLIMRMYFEIVDRVIPQKSEQARRISEELNHQFDVKERKQSLNSTK